MSLSSIISTPKKSKYTSNTLKTYSNDSTIDSNVSKVKRRKVTNIIPIDDIIAKVINYLIVKNYDEDYINYIYSQMQSYNNIASRLINSYDQNIDKVKKNSILIASVLIYIYQKNNNFKENFDKIFDISLFNINYIKEMIDDNYENDEVDVEFIPKYIYSFSNFRVNIDDFKNNDDRNTYINNYMKILKKCKKFNDSSIDSLCFCQSEQIENLH
jgi:hypothetical protein